MKDFSKDQHHRAVEEAPAFLPVPVYVQCEGFRSLAYRDSSGNWRSFYTDNPILGTVRLIASEES